MAKGIEKDWGEWLLARSRFVGFKRQSDLARAVGCTRQHLTKWLQMEQPPQAMRKGFDKSLAYALQTTQPMLFTDWVNTAPEKARKIVFHADQLPLDEEQFMSDEADDVLRKVVSWLMPDEVEWILLQCALEALKKNDTRAPIFRKILDRCKLLDMVDARGRPKRGKYES